MSGATRLVFAMQDKANGEPVDVCFYAGFDGSTPPLDLVIDDPEGGAGASREAALSFTSTQVRALRVFCDLALLFPYDNQADEDFEEKASQISAETRANAREAASRAAPPAWIRRANAMAQTLRRIRWQLLEGLDKTNAATLVQEIDLALEERR